MRLHTYVRTCTHACGLLSCSLRLVTSQGEIAEYSYKELLDEIARVVPKKDRAGSGRTWFEKARETRYVRVSFRAAKYVRTYVHPLFCDAHIRTYVHIRKHTFARFSRLQVAWFEEYAALGNHFELEAKLRTAVGNVEGVLVPVSRGEREVLQPREGHDKDEKTIPALELSSIGSCTDSISTMYVRRQVRNSIGYTISGWGFFSPSFTKVAQESKRG